MRLTARSSGTQHSPLAEDECVSDLEGYQCQSLCEQEPDAEHIANCLATRAGCDLAFECAQQIPLWIGPRAACNHLCSDLWFHGCVPDDEASLCEERCMTATEERADAFAACLREGAWMSRQCEDNRCYRALVGP